jgi:hypothetical protein
VENHIYITLTDPARSIFTAALGTVASKIAFGAATVEAALTLGVVFDEVGAM